MSNNRLKIEDYAERQAVALETLAYTNGQTLFDDWKYVQKMVQLGSAAKAFAVGNQFSEDWKDTVSNTNYTNPFNVAHFGTAELQDGETIPAMYLQNAYAHPVGVQFSHPRAFLACPDGLSAGTYTIHMAKAWSKLTALDWTFTLTKDVPAGGRLAGFYQMADSAKTTDKVYSYAANGIDINETVSATATTGGVDLGTMNMDSRNGNLNSMEETGYGCNRWKTSAIRQYLNSDKGVGAWWVAQDAWDIAPDQLATKAGYLSGLSEDFKAVMKTVKVTTYTNTVTEGGTADVTYDKVFLPSLEEMHINPQVAGEGETWEYWLRASQQAAKLSQYATYPQIITYAAENHTSAQYIRLRSANRGFAYNTWIVYGNGHIYYNYACGAFRFAPACVVG